MELIILVSILSQFLCVCRANLGVSVQNRRRPISFQSQVTISGGVSYTKLEYPDKLTIDTYSASEHNMTVAINPAPSASPLFVTAIDPSTSALSGTWVPMSKYSYTLDFEIEDPDDLIMNIGAPTWSTDVDEIMDDNVFLGKYHKERKGWVIDFERATFHRAQNRTGCIGLSNPAGEYIVIGRRIPSTNGAYNTFLAIDDGVFEVIGSPVSKDPNNIYPLQIGTWSDGTRIMVRSQMALKITMSLSVITEDFVPAGYQAVSTYIHAIRSQHARGEVELRIQLPAVRTRLVSHHIHPNQLQICKRRVIQNQETSGPCEIISPAVPAGTGALMTETSIGLDGDYLLIAPKANNSGNHQLMRESHRQGIECETGNSTSVDGIKLCGLMGGESMSGSEVEGSRGPLKTTQVALLGNPGPVIPFVGPPKVTDVSINSSNKLSEDPTPTSRLSPEVSTAGNRNSPHRKRLVIDYQD
ncbi:hypothetical protein CROQUDRAFT_47989 [Cronartium quercuum f. sp. fusiforme G11]|uniref:IgGFc-binding protein N-terminal domain-containing protein n=1 Tax=Cronartium quercuum f. sp. fusiforme G11 TaxID=708437 RepID=A0A9P6TAV1_9BASI|nr:hypothetical protein CROQUDRAFT_47989 [Cronartium quercuum f. sp. fusiforme G11]